MNPASLDSVLDHFEHTLQSHAGYALAVARDCPPGGSTAWDAIMSQLGLTPLPPEQRGPAAAEARITRGALPQQVHQVLSVLATQAGQTLDLICHQYGPPAAASARVGALRTRLGGFADSQVQTYEAELRPARRGGTGLAGIFANVKATAQLDPWKSLKFDNQLTLACPTCGAVQKTALRFDCEFCRGSLFAT